MGNFNIENEVVVVGGNHHNALGLIRSMGETGWKVNYISTETGKNFVSKSRYVKRFWIAQNEEKLIELLLKTHANKKSIIIPSDDSAMTMIDNNFSILKEKYIIPNVKNKENAVSNMMNKVEMTKLAEKHGFLVPKGFKLDLKKSEEVNLVIESINFKYPCIVKPLKSIDGSKGDIIICNDITQLTNQIRNLEDKYSEVILQEFIKKDGELGVQGLSTRKEIIIPGIIEKKRDSPIAPGSTTYATLVESNSLVEKDKIISLLRDLNYYGIFDLELMYQNKKVYFIEINFRNGAYGYAYTKAGVNIPKLWCLDAVGLNISDETKKVVKHLRLMNEIADFRNVINKNVSFIKWLKEFVSTDIYMLLNIKDIKPFIYKFIYK